MYMVSMKKLVISKIPISKEEEKVSYYQLNNKGNDAVVAFAQDGKIIWFDE